VNGRFERKNRIGKSNGDGYYATEAAAARDIHNHRMLFEGFVKRGGLWYDPTPMPPTPIADAAAAAMAMNTDLDSPVSSAGVVPLGRPCGPQGSKRDASISCLDDDGAVATAKEAAAAKDEKYCKLSQRPPHVRPNLKWGNQKAPKDKHQAAAAAAAASRKNDSFAEKREGARRHLLGALKDVSEVKLCALIVDRELGPNDGDMYVSKWQIHHVRQQAIAVFNFYGVLNESYPARNQVWCAAEAAERMGCVVTGGTVSRWGREFMAMGGFLADARGTYERSVFVEEEDVKPLMKAWMVGNLKHLSRDKCAVWVNKTLIPLVVEGDEEAIKKVMMEKYKVKYPVCPETCGVWMLRCGAKYCKKEQSFYHDLHEHPNNIADRNSYIPRDMGTEAHPSPRELAQYQWVQMTKAKAVSFIAAHEAPGAAAHLWRQSYEYAHRGSADVQVLDGIVIGVALPIDAAVGDAVGDAAVARWRSLEQSRARFVEEGEVMVEFHVEVSEALDAWRATTMFGGHLSVRRLPCQPALIKLGQDESIFSSEAASSRHWVVDDRSHLTPKSGISLMVSGFTGGAVGFGMALTDEQLEEVNEYRRRPENNTYVCGKYNAPQTLCALGGVPVSDKKPDLKESPGIRMIFNCKAGDGYWTSSHMMVQSEDVADVVRALFPWVNLCGEFDHSGVHGIQKKDALNVKKMSAGYGGAQTLKRPTVMTAGCLGPFPAFKVVDGVEHNVKLKVGDTQHMVFQEGDLPPHYAPKAPKVDTPSGKDVKPRGGKKKKTNTYKQQMGGGEEEDEPVVEMVAGMVKGYEGAPKGIKDVLFERGWLNPQVEYTMKGTNGADGILDEATSLECIMASCEDFREETTAMHEFMELLGVEMEKTPKGHPELAGCGVEYGWGKSKYTFRHINNYSSNKVAFMKIVRQSLASVTLERARRFLRRANDYKRAYRALAEGAGAEAVAAYADIEKLRKESKAHRCTFDQDYKFITLS
jgi:hypothetical protein